MRRTTIFADDHLLKEIKNFTGGGRWESAGSDPVPYYFHHRKSIRFLKSACVAKPTFFNSLLSVSPSGNCLETMIPQCSLFCPTYRLCSRTKSLVLKVTKQRASYTANASCSLSDIPFLSGLAREEHQILFATRRTQGRCGYPHLNLRTILVSSAIIFIVRDEIGPDFSNIQY